MLSPLESYLNQQLVEIGLQENKVDQQTDINNYMSERTPPRNVNAALPCCSKCHRKEGHNRLNCPYPNPCSSATFCGVLEKHPEDKLVLKRKNKELAAEKKSLLAMREELKNRQKASESVSNRYITRVRQTLIESAPDKYLRKLEDGTVIEDWRRLNMDSKILEKQCHGKIPSPSEAYAIIQGTHALVPHKVSGKTTVHNPYKKLWESRGVSWPAQPRRESTTESFDLTAGLDRDNTLLDETVHSPERKKVAVSPNEDYELALAMQRSLDTLPVNTSDSEQF